MSLSTRINRLLGRFKSCRTCGAQEPRGFTQSADTFWICTRCKGKTVAEVFDPLLVRRTVTPPSDPTRRALRNQGDDLDPLNPLSLTSPLTPVYHSSSRADWDDSPHRHHSGGSCHSSHDDGGSYDSGSSSDSSSGGSCD